MWSLAHGRGLRNKWIMNKGMIEWMNKWLNRYRACQTYARFIFLSSKMSESYLIGRFCEVFHNYSVSINFLSVYNLGHFIHVTVTAVNIYIWVLYVCAGCLETGILHDSEDSAPSTNHDTHRKPVHICTLFTTNFSVSLYFWNSTQLHKCFPRLPSLILKSTIHSTTRLIFLSWIWEVCRNARTLMKWEVGPSDFEVVAFFKICSPPFLVVLIILEF